MYSGTLGIDSDPSGKIRGHQIWTISEWAKNIGKTIQTHDFETKMRENCALRSPWADVDPTMKFPAVDYPEHINKMEHPDNLGLERNKKGILIWT